ncbi:Phage shock protein A @ Suppressor of sigma54-dependent transcription, PspA-like [hydrothermal vent metagenome]|uniref:Phage shock protein A @ Suppressor of sigma54-dependent transcription, PspA-like n=1 Tax=hydrothermal vent metagenome TaxID=652676 RepID=A0A3B0RPT2_9ZZZZ
MTGEMAGTTSFPPPSVIRAEVRSRPPFQIEELDFIENNFYKDDNYQDQPERSNHSRHNASNYRSYTMSIFTRTRDIIAANVTDMLDKAEDPSKLIRMIILEMEETLVDVRASAARTIADQKEMRRHIDKLERLDADWHEKAQLALSKDREDLAKAALVEKRKASDMADQLKVEIGVLDDALRANEGDIAKLQKKLQEARSRQSSLVNRLESAENRYKIREMYNSEKVHDAFSKFEYLERQVDFAEGRADAIGMGSEPQTLENQIAALESSDKIDDELEAMKAAMKKSSPKGDE